MKSLLISFLLIAMSLSFNTNLSAQKLNHVLGEVLIQLDTETNIRQLSNQLQTYNHKPTQIKVIKQVSKHMRIWRLSFDYTNINEYDFLAYLSGIRAIQNAQFNHLIDLRETPNDPQFVDQWQYINDGSNGGTVGADIDMDLAWDNTTGGLTADGDTIVVCIVDNGLDPSHQDFEDNIWVNHAEIPNNGIDDDNNGFIDDYAGWNTGSGDDDIDEANWHGTPVAGIIGAKGNNNLGVAGINWNVKLMIVVGGTNVESEVLEAYSFPLAHRIRYNETNGEEGSFVVATNSSWGQNEGQPEDAPLWCAFYDTLGVHGILSAGATANAEFNIDEVGDLPTACSSDYLLSVTNMNRTDTKVNGAGYGLTTIDLGAFGEGTWTVADNNGYGGFGGTSGATPHVAGAIALLYSAPCSELIAIAKNNPGEAALLVKNYILNGVDPNESLDGITVTGGRLNVNNSMNLLLANCGPCPAPSRLRATELTDVSTDLEWTVSDSTLSSQLQWRPAGAAMWTTVDNATSPYALDGLSPCSEYEFQIIATCADTTNNSNVVSFITDGCCVAPDMLNLVELTDSTAHVNWNGVLAANSYNAEIRPIGGQDWTLINLDSTSLTFTDLISCTDYVVRVQTVCDTGLTDFTPILTFSTFGCGACTDLVYCTSESEDSSDEALSSITLGEFTNNSGNDGGYGDYTGSFIELMTYNTYPLTLTPEFGGQSFNERYRIWIDLNQDGEFGTGERVFDSQEASNETVTGEMTIPGDATLGLTRMRISMEWAGFNGASAPTPCETLGFGEVEDYCVTILEGVEPCLDPVALEATNISMTGATLNWASASTTLSYNLRYRAVGAMDWIEGTTTDISYSISDLIDCTEYEFEVQAVCDTARISEYASASFFTECPCGMPSNFTRTIGFTSVEITWDAVDNANSYDFRYKADGTAAWTSINDLTTPSISLSSLDSCSLYEFQARTVCTGTSSEFTTGDQFETDCLIAVNELEVLSPINIYPNPFNELFQLRFELARVEDIQLSIYNTTGQLIQSSKFNSVAGLQTIDINTDQWAQGIYFLQLTSDTGSSTRRLIKQ